MFIRIGNIDICTEASKHWNESLEAEWVSDSGFENTTLNENCITKQNTDHHSNHYHSSYPPVS